MPIIEITGQKCLHEIQKSVNQLSYMEEHIKALRHLINVMIERTYAKAPLRKRSYHLLQPERTNPIDRERLLEKAFWMQFGFRQCDVQSLKRVVDVLHIQTYQMPLQSARTDIEWGKVDLAGVSVENTPVVFELKQEDSKDTPLRMIVEGLAYAIALRRAWNEGNLRQEWIRDVTSRLNLNVPPQTLLTVPIVGLAPFEYWEKRSTEGQSGFVKPAVGRLFRELCNDLALRGFPVSFVQFTADDEDASGVPIIKDVSQLQLPW